MQTQTIDQKLITWFRSLHPAARQQFMMETAGKLNELHLSVRGSKWPDQYTNASTGKAYEPHNEQEREFVYSNNYIYGLLSGGEGGGKSVAGTIKDLNNLRAGINGVLVSPDFEHFKKSLWPEFKRWCPWQCVIERHRYRQAEGWEPSKAFTLVFHSEIGGFSELQCGGAKESEIESWRGPNIGFVHLDEASRHNTPAALKLFAGRIRIPGNRLTIFENGKHIVKENPYQPQLYFTTTPKKHWLFEYFAGARGDEHNLHLLPDDIKQKYAAFRNDAFVARVTTLENEQAGNLSAGFTDKRGQSLTEAEIRVLLKAEWEDVSDVEKFVNIVWWDACQQPMAAMTPHTPMVIALDAAKGGETNLPDCFAMVGVSRAGEIVQIRYCGIWTPNPVLDFEPIENELIRLCQQFSVLEVCYDPYQLHDMATRLKKRGVANFQEFSQGKDRLVADKQLQDLIMSRRVAHDGNPLLRQHIDNANIKKGGQDGVRIVKRSPSLKVDASVALSMAASRVMFFNI